MIFVSHHIKVCNFVMEMVKSVFEVMKENFSTVSKMYRVFIAFSDYKQKKKRKRNAN